MKGVTASFQFLIFILIGLMLFILISSLFKTQLEAFRVDVANEYTKLTASHLSAMAIVENSCSSCQEIIMETKLQNVTAGYVVLLEFGGTVTTKFFLTASTEPGGYSYTSYLHNLGETFTMIGQANSIETISLTLTKAINTLEVSNS